MRVQLAVDSSHLQRHAAARHSYCDRVDRRALELYAPIVHVLYRDESMSPFELKLAARPAAIAVH